MSSDKLDSPAADYAIQSQRVVLSSQALPCPARLQIKDGKIVAIRPVDEPVGDTPLIDVGTHAILPGIVDTHAHINEPGRTDWEGFQSATRAAAAGGVTTLIDMPLNSIPATTTLEALEIKAAAADGACQVDYGFWGGVIPGNTPELAGMIEGGVMGFKAFLIDSGVSEFPMSRESDLREAMPVLARAGVPLIAHAELESGSPAATTPDPRSYESYLRSRPPEWETNAIRLLITLARETNCPVHIVHLSAAEALSELDRARAQGLAVTVETCPHYLTFCAEDIESGATHFKCAPPIRETSNREKLWSALSENRIQMVVSDHSPCTPALKERQSGDFAKAWGGISGLQFSLPATWTGLRQRGLGLEHLVRLMCENTARLVGLSTRKGRLAEGFDADLVIFNPDANFTVREDDVQHRHRLTPYTGRALSGVVHQTYVRGNLVYDNGAFPAAPKGQRLRRPRETGKGASIS